MPALALLTLACSLPVSNGCVTPKETLPPAPEAPAGTVFVLTREGQVRFGESRWDLDNPNQAARLTVLLTRLAQGAEEPTLIFLGESGTTFAEVKLLMDFLAMAEIDDYRVDLGNKAQR